ncbi:MAG: DUF3298 and DUF4163 domain-containing protein [Patescibacteria group bacterium]|nr:DUF3298 and DUF4163 domain-containing protein [Patescibacteria group bacterium]
MKKYFLVLVCILLVSGWGCREKDAPVDQAITLPKVNNEEPALAWGLSYATTTISEETEKYYLDINYPVFSGDNQKIVDGINGKIKAKVDQNVQQFRNDYADIDHEYDPGPWFLGYDFSVTRNDQYFISVVLEGSIYTGGAHPNQMYETFVFNMEEGGELMSLEDVFNPMATAVDEDTGASLSWLEYVSNQSRLKLMSEEYADADWINSGAGVNSDNFKLFYLTESGIVFIFPPYQVAAYAAGPQEVGFDYDDLAGYLKAYGF